MTDSSMGGSPINSWNDLDREGGPGEPGEALGEMNAGGVGFDAGHVPIVEHEHELDHHDVEGHQPSEFDGHVVEGLVHEPGDEVAQPKKKTGLLLALIAGAIVVVGGMGFALYAMLSAPASHKGGSAGVVVPEASPALQESAASEVEAPASAVNVAAAPPASAAAPDAGASAVAGAVTVAQSVPAAQPASTVSASPAVATVAAPAGAGGKAPDVVGALKVLGTEVESLDKRVAALEQGGSSQAQGVAHRATGASVHKAGHRQTGHHKVAEHSSHKSGEPRQEKDVKGVASASDGTEATSEAVSKGGALSGVTLLSVNPLTGPDMQAWVDDDGRVVVLSAGATIRGAKVERIEHSRVVTSKGDIR